MRLFAGLLLLLKTAIGQTLLDSTLTPIPIPYGVSGAGFAHMQMITTFGRFSSHGIHEVDVLVWDTHGWSFSSFVIQWRRRFLFKGRCIHSPHRHDSLSLKSPFV
jgi:hypothetical protein